MNIMGIDRIGGANNASLYTNVSRTPNTGREAENAANLNEQAPQTQTQQVQPKETEVKTNTEARPSSDPKAKTADGKEEENSLLEIDEKNNAKVKNAIAEVNKKMSQRTRCEFSYHEDTKRVSIKVIDSDTDKIIREIPPEETLDMLSKMWEAAGILVDAKR